MTTPRTFSWASSAAVLRAGAGSETWRQGAATAAAAALFAVLFTLALDRFAPPPSAQAARASEGAFASGMHWREFPPPTMGPTRWTTGRTELRFRYLPPGPASLEVRVRNHRFPVRVVAGGAVVATIPAGATAARALVPIPSSGALDLELLVAPFVSGGGRRLGTLLEEVTVRPSLPRLPRPGLVFCFLVPAIATVLAGFSTGAGSRLALALAIGLTLGQGLLLWPQGLLRSPFAAVLSGILAALALVAAVLTRLVTGSRPHTGGGLFAALLFAGAAAVAVGPHPMVIGFDGVFHGHKLLQVAGGDLFPVSLTQHSPPFRFPYGFTFYAALSPLVRAGLDAVSLVRAGAGIAALAGTAILAMLLARRRMEIAPGALALLPLIPWSTAVFSNGNFSNVFGQACTLGFFAWWAGGSAGGWIVGALLFVAGAMAHLSSFVVLVVLAAALVLLDRQRLRRDRVRLAALGVGLLLATAYYGSFAGLIAEQLPRMAEGTGGGFGFNRLWAGLLRQGGSALTQWGVPAIVLAVLGRPRPRAGDFDRDLAAFWLAGALLAVIAIVSPLEVRYLYALTAPLAIAAASGARFLLGRGAVDRVAAALLLGAQAVLGLRAMVLAVVSDWRYPIP